jgi:hypothetical protein
MAPRFMLSAAAIPTGKIGVSLHTARPRRPADPGPQPGCCHLEDGPPSVRQRAADRFLVRDMIIESLCVVIPLIGGRAAHNQRLWFLGWPFCPVSAGLTGDRYGQRREASDGL